MLDINKIRDDKSKVRKALLKRMEAKKLDPILDLVLKLNEDLS